MIINIFDDNCFTFKFENPTIVTINFIMKSPWGDITKSWIYRQINIKVDFEINPISDAEALNLVDWIWNNGLPPYPPVIFN